MAALNTLTPAASPKSIRARLNSECGAELLEFALVFPLLLMVVLGIVDFGFLFQRMEVVTNAAREGARIAVLPGYATADVTARVNNYVQTGGVPTTTSPANPVIQVTNVSIPTGAGGPNLTGKRVQVTSTHSYIFIGPIAGWFGGSFTTVPVSAVSIMRDELATAGAGS
jgi:Flp pilus assembly protein TadG